MGPTAGQISLLVDDGIKEGRTVTDERTAMSMQKEFECHTRAYQGATVRASRTDVGQVRDEKVVFTHRKNQTVGEAEG